jgi:fermentation-respiration switch protein FrsA (DUF1100 family)
VRPLSLIGKIPPRPILLVHGANDEVVPVLDARALADAAGGEVELRVLSGAAHRLRTTPAPSPSSSGGSTASRADPTTLGPSRWVGARRCQPQPAALSTATRKRRAADSGSSDSVR